MSLDSPGGLDVAIARLLYTAQTTLTLAHEFAPMVVGVRGDEVIVLGIARPFMPSERVQVFSELAWLAGCSGADGAAIAADIWFRDVGGEAEARAYLEAGLAPEEDPRSVNALAVFIAEAGQEPHSILQEYHRGDDGSLSFGEVRGAGRDLSGSLEPSESVLPTGPAVCSMLDAAIRRDLDTRFSEAVELLRISGYRVIT